MSEPRTTDMNQHDEAFERGMVRGRRSAKRRLWYGNIRVVVLMILLVGSSMGIGWGWGYNVRVSEQCAALGGQWQAHALTCVGPEGEIPLN